MDFPHKFSKRYPNLTFSQKVEKQKNSFCFLTAIKSITFSKGKIGFFTDMRGSTFKSQPPEMRDFRNSQTKFSSYPNKTPFDRTELI